MGNILSRIDQLARKEGITIGALERQIGASKGVLSRAISNGTDIQSKWVQKIIENYPHISADWLVAGRGPMLQDITNKENLEKTSQKRQKIASDPARTLQKADAPGEGLPLIPLEVAAGFPLIDSAGIAIEDCDRYIVPEFQSRGAQFLIRVSGNSMYPRYSNGDILACRWIEEIRFLQWGKVYVIDSSQGQLVKMIFEDKSPDSILCVSENTKDFPPFSLPKDDIRSISYVIGCIKLE